MARTNGHLRQDSTSAAPAVVLISGSPRTGTTLLAEILNESPRAAVMFEYGLGDLLRDMSGVFTYGRARDEWYRNVRGVSAQTATADTYPFARTSAARRYPSASRFAAIVSAVVEATLGKNEVALIGSKTAGATEGNTTAAIAELFSDVRHLLTVRSPLGTINSMMNRRNLARRGLDEWPIDDVAAAITEYRRGVLILLSRVARAPDRAFVVPYEDVVASYDRTVSAIGAFLGLELPPSSTSRVAKDGANTRPVLTDEEETIVRSSFPGAIAMWDEKPLAGMHADGRLDDLADCLEPIVPGHRYTYATGARSFLGAGWSISQPEGVWTDDARADLFFPAPRSRRYQLLLEGSFFLPDAGASVTIVLEHAGREIFRGTCMLGGETVAADATNRFFAGPGPRTLVTLPFEPDGLITRVSLHLDGASTPLAAGFSGDDRLLGFLLQSLTLRDV